MKTRSFAAVALLAVTLAAGCDRQEAAWREAEEADTMGAYRQYLENYPESPNAEEARQRMLALRRENLWRQAEQADSVEGYQAFLAEFPEGEEAEQARSRLAGLQGQSEWEALRGSRDPAALREFAERYQGRPIGDQARQRLEELEVAAREAEAREQARLEDEEERRRAEEAAATHRVQLAALRSEQQARDGTRVLEEQLGDLLGDTGIEVAQSGGFYLLRTEPLSEQEALALCERLRERDEECLVVRR
jgi:hypothetical protein